MKQKKLFANPLYAVAFLNKYYEINSLSHIFHQHILPSKPIHQIFKYKIFEVLPYISYLLQAMHH